jgi:hypothetical protein
MPPEDRLTADVYLVLDWANKYQALETLKSASRGQVQLPTCAWRVEGRRRKGGKIVIGRLGYLYCRCTKCYKQRIICNGSDIQQVSCDLAAQFGRFTQPCHHLTAYHFNLPYCLLHMQCCFSVMYNIRHRVKKDNEISPQCNHNHNHNQ